MVDMVFLILVFFMCVSHLSDPAHAFDVDLPQAGVRGDTLADEGVMPTVFILADATIHLAGQATDVDSLAKMLSSAIQSDPALQVRIKADRLTPWSAVQPVIDALTQAGVTHLLITSIEGETASHE